MLSETGSLASASVPTDVADGQRRVHVAVQINDRLRAETN